MTSFCSADYSHDLTTRSANVLWQAGARSWSDVERMDLGQLLRQPNCGRKTVKEIEEAIWDRKVRWPNGVTRRRAEAIVDYQAGRISWEEMISRGRGIKTAEDF